MKNLPSMGDRALLRRLIIFEDETLLEFLSPSPDAPATGDEFREWVEKHEGGMSLALRSSSAQDAAAYLEARNFEVIVRGWPRARVYLPMRFLGGFTSHEKEIS